MENLGLFERNLRLREVNERLYLNDFDEDNKVEGCHRTYVTKDKNKMVDVQNIKDKIQHVQDVKVKKEED